jgi:hypothetical protein
MEKIARFEKLENIGSILQNGLAFLEKQFHPICSLKLLVESKQGIKSLLHLNMVRKQQDQCHHYCCCC